MEMGDCVVEEYTLKLDTQLLKKIDMLGVD